MQTLERILLRLGPEQFWGTITIHYKNGRAIYIQKQEQITLKQKNEEVTSRKNHRDFHDPQGCGHGNSDGTTV